jgi:hypothetical protein
VGLAAPKAISSIGEEVVRNTQHQGSTSFPRDNASPRKHTSFFLGKENTLLENDYS